MRSAPSVSYPVGRSSFLGRLLLVLAVAGLAALLLALAYGTGMTVGWWLAVTTWACWLVLAWGAWRRQPGGRLAWKASGGRADKGGLAGSAGDWVWSSGAYLEGVTLARVERIYDLQACMLLRLHNPDGARIWAWVERSHDESHWSDLRRALVAHA